LIIPIGDLGAQELMIYRRTPEGLEERRAGSVRFVPLISRFAFADREWR
jgi:protein-L-isoaspartate O-methyltransferase